MKPTDIIQVRKVKCPWCKGAGKRLPQGDRAKSYPVPLDPCDKCNGNGYRVYPERPSDLRVDDVKIEYPNAVTYPPCPKCGRRIKILLRKDGSCFVEHHYAPGASAAEDVCPESGRDGKPFLKKEPRSVQYRRDQRAKRRLDAAIKKHDAAEARRKLEQLSYDLGGL